MSFKPEKMDFATCGNCGYRAFIGGIDAPPGESPDELRAAIRREGKGPAVCPRCKLPVMFRLIRLMELGAPL